VAGFRDTCTVGRFEDGGIIKMVLTNHKAGTHAGILASDAAAVTRIDLQYRAQLDVIRKALMRNAVGKASGLLGAAPDKIEEAAP
jgi:hypothetical protein